MKKVLLFVLMLTSIIFLGACDKKSYQARSMENFFEDFELTSKGIDVFERIIKDEQGPNKYSYLGNFSHVTLSPKRKTLIRSVSFTIYNYSDNNTFYYRDPSSRWFEKVEGNYYTAGEYDTNLIEIGPGTEFDAKYTIDLKLKAKQWVQVTTLPYINIEHRDEDYQIIKDSYGIYKFKVDYEVYM